MYNFSPDAILNVQHQYKEVFKYFQENSWMESKQACPTLNE